MERAPLIDLTITYFKRRGYKIERDVLWEGRSGILRRFDLILRRDDEQILVWVKDWKRTVGVNMIINVDKAAADVEYPHPIIVSEKFSDHAKAYANRRGVTLLTRRQIMQRVG